MAELKKNSEPNHDRVRFSSDCELVEVREEDTTPGQPSERYRQWLREKYGRKGDPSTGTGAGTEL
jgi:hypothetical protein